MKRRDFLSTLGLIGLLTFAPGCQRASPPLRIGGHLWPGYEFMFLAREGWISPQDTVLVETGAATESLKKLAAGEIDGAALTLDEVLRARDQGVPLMAVLVFDISMGADVLLAKPGIETLAQIKGKRIGLEQTALGALMLHKSLEAAGLTAADVKTFPVTADQHLATWQAGKIDALITFEPVSSQLQADGALRLFDSSAIPNTIIDVLAVTPTAANRQRDALGRLVAAHFQGRTKFRKNPNDITYRVAERLKLNPKDVIGAFKGLELPGELANRKLLQGDQAPVLTVARQLGEVMARAGIVKPDPINLSGLVSADFIPGEEAK